MDEKKLLETYKKAKEVLSSNRYAITLNGKRFRRLVPSREFYVHQWNWDSCTHAMGLVHLDDELAFDEIRSLLSGQWKNGLVPQITFNPQEKKYFPGPEFWGTEDMRTGEIITSGITQPPLLAVSIEYVFKHAKNKAGARKWLDEVLPGVLSYHQHLQTFRDSENSGLLTIIHPWEAGTDNSPLFDEALEGISLVQIPQSVKDMVDHYRTDDKEGVSAERPRLHDYYRYLYLVQLYKDWKWDSHRIVRESPFAIKDILVSSIWARANTSLAALLRETGEMTKADTYETWAMRTMNALREEWDEKLGVFIEREVSQGKNKPIKEDTIASFLPLYAHAADEKILAALLKKLTDPALYWLPFPVPSTSLRSPKFDAKRYWRGPTWPITNLFLIDGLNNYKGLQVEDAQKLILEKTLTAISNKGFSEYSNPLENPDKRERTSLGFGSFSWTASIFIYLFHRRAEYNLTSA